MEARNKPGSTGKSAFGNTSQMVHSHAPAHGFSCDVLQMNHYLYQPGQVRPYFLPGTNARLPASILNNEVPSKQQSLFPRLFEAADISKPKNSTNQFHSSSILNYSKKSLDTQNTNSETLDLANKEIKSETIECNTVQDGSRLAVKTEPQEITSTYQDSIPQQVVISFSTEHIDEVNDVQQSVIPRLHQTADIPKQKSATNQCQSISKFKNRQRSMETQDNIPLAIEKVQSDPVESSIDQDGLMVAVKSEPQEIQSFEQVKGEYYIKTESLDIPFIEPIQTEVDAISTGLEAREKTELLYVTCGQTSTHDGVTKIEDVESVNQVEITDQVKTEVEKIDFGDVKSGSTDTIIQSENESNMCSIINREEERNDLKIENLNTADSEVKSDAEVENICLHQSYTENMGTIERSTNAQNVPCTSNKVFQETSMQVLKQLTAPIRNVFTNMQSKAVDFPLKQTMSSTYSRSGSFLWKVPGSKTPYKITILDPISNKHQQTQSFVTPSQVSARNDLINTSPPNVASCQLLQNARSHQPVSTICGFGLQQTLSKTCKDENIQPMAARPLNHSIAPLSQHEKVQYSNVVTTSFKSQQYNEMVECNKVTSDNETHRHLKYQCTQPSIPNNDVTSCQLKIVLKNSQSTHNYDISQSKSQTNIANSPICTSKIGSVKRNLYVDPTNVEQNTNERKTYNSVFTRRKQIYKTFPTKERDLLNSMPTKDIKEVCQSMQTKEKETRTSTLIEERETTTYKQYSLSNCFTRTTKSSENQEENEFTKARKRLLNDLRNYKQGDENKKLAVLYSFLKLLPDESKHIFEQINSSELSYERNFGRNHPLTEPIFVRFSDTSDTDNEQLISFNDLMIQQVEKMYNYEELKKKKIKNSKNRRLSHDSKDPVDDNIKLTYKDSDTLNEKKEHVKTQRPYLYSCVFCNCKYLTRPHLGAHLGAHIKTHWTDPSFVCTFCRHYRREKENIFIEHTIRSHMIQQGKLENDSSTPLLYSCCICGSGDISYHKIIPHLKKHFNSASFSCEMCESFKKMEKRLDFHARNTHFIKHKGEEKTTLKSTEIVIHDISLKEKTVDSRKVKDELFALCHVCGECIKGKLEMLAHKKLHKKRSKAFKCDQCGMRLSSRDRLLSHINSHKVDEGNKDVHSCSYCSRSFLNRLILLNHQKTHWVKENHFFCMICHALYSSRAACIQHMREHGKSLPVRRWRPLVKCLKCDELVKESYFSSHVKRHERKFSDLCNICGRGFYNGIKYKEHLRMHSGEKPLTCDLCGKRYGDYFTLVTHIKNHLGDKLYKCEVCNMNFVMMSNLIEHMKRSPSHRFQLKRKFDAT